jgi:hypothetical protein
MKKIALHCIFIGSLLFNLAFASTSECIPGSIMVDKPGKPSDATDYIKYSKNLLGHSFENIPDKDQYITFMLHYGDQYYTISPSDWCYSPATHSILFLRKPLTYWDNWGEVTDGSSLFIFYHRAIA